LEEVAPFMLYSKSVIHIKGGWKMFMFVIVALLLIGIGVYYMVRALNYKKYWIPIQGRIKAHKKARTETPIDNGTSTPSSFEQVSYSVGKKEYAIWTSYSTAFPYRVGSTIPIRYHPLHHNEMVIDTFGRLYVLPLFLIVLGIALLYLSFMSVMGG